MTSTNESARNPLTSSFSLLLTRLTLCLFIAVYTLILVLFSGSLFISHWTEQSNEFKRGIQPRRSAAIPLFGLFLLTRFCQPIAPPLTSPTPQPPLIRQITTMAIDARDSAIRDAKRYIRDVVRNDWTFQPSTDAGAPATSFPPPPQNEVSAWRLREYDSSGSELEPQMSPTGYDDDSSQPGSPMMSPIGGRAERRRKRRRDEEEEMRWNEGLRTWVERRDAWSGARAKPEILGEPNHPDVSSDEAAAGMLDSSSSSSPHPADSSNLATRTGASLTISDKDATPLQQDREGEDHSTTAADGQQGSTETAITEPDTQGATVTTPAPAPATAASKAVASTVAHQERPEEAIDPVIPVVPSLISTTNPIRASITPAMYPSIYSKVVVQGLTPTVPINLADVTKAMVQGWKSDGQWPPKPTNIVLQDDATVPRARDDISTAAPSAAAAADKQPPSPESKRRSGVASAVRKVLHFSGFHPSHPFHRRGSSQPSEEAAAHAVEHTGENA